MRMFVAATLVGGSTPILELAVLALTFEPALNDLTQTAFVGEQNGFEPLAPHRVQLPTRRALRQS